MIQRDDVLDGPAEIGFPLRREQDSTGANVLRASNERYAFCSGTGD
jgi:hypothetical protein